MYNKLFIMISLITDFFTKNKKIILFSGLFLFLFYLFGDSAFAAGSDFTNADNTLNDTWKDVNKIFTWIWTTITVFLSLLTYLTTVFLSPEWINGSIFWLNVYFKSIWIMISNLVYLIFAFILIWIAFMNIIWKWWDKYQLKQALPKLVIWILIVPLSWFIVQFILSLSAILTISSLNLPFNTFTDFESNIAEVKIPTDCKLNLKEWELWANGKKDEWAFSCKEWDWSTKFLKDILNSWEWSDAIFGILGTYTYWVLSLENISKLNSIDLTVIKTIPDLVVKIIFDLLFIIIYAVLMIALWLVLMVRWIYIWIYMMISPVFWLMYFFDKSEWGWEFFDKFNIKQFISLALVPVYAMLALSFWLLFMYIVGQWMTKVENKVWISWIEIQKIWDNWSKILIGWNWEWSDKFALTITWAPVNPKNITDFTDIVWNGALWVIWTLILKLFGVVVLWWAVMAALRSNDITKAVVEPLHAFGGQVWGLVTKSPQYLPIFGGQSMKSMWTIAWAVQWHVDQKSRDRATWFTSKHMKFLDASSTAKKADMNWIVDRVEKWSHTDWRVTDDLKGEWIKFLKTLWDTQGWVTLDAEKWMKLFAKKAWVSESDIKWMKFSNKTWYADAIRIIESQFDSNTSVWWALSWEQTLANKLWSDDVDNLMQKLNPSTNTSSWVNNNQNSTTINVNWVWNVDFANRVYTDSSNKIQWLNDTWASVIADSIWSISDITKSDFKKYLIEWLTNIYWNDLNGKWTDIVDDIIKALEEKWKTFKS